MKLIGANPAPQIMGLDQLSGKSNYFIGNDPKKWHSNILHYARVQYRDVYPGVDLIYYGRERQLEYDFVVAPGADPRLIKLAFEGAEKVDINAQGDLILHTSAGEVRMHKPLIYQDVAGLKQPVPGRYVLNPKSKIENPKSKIQNRTVGFQVAGYDASRPLVIDPVLAYSTYLGGSGGDVANSIAVDSEGNVYVTGQTESPDFPLANPWQSTNGGSTNVFVTKLDSTGTTLVYSTYLGGSSLDRGNSIAVDSAGNAYVTGRVSSDDFPTTPGALLTSFRGGTYDAFVAKLNAEGNALVYSTYFGGFDNDAGFGIAVDSEGNAYVTGGTRSDDFPITANALQSVLGGTLDAFLAKLDSTGSTLVYSTYLGGSFVDRGNSIVVDSEGNAYVTGWTESPDFPTANAFQPANGGGRDAFVTKLNVGGDNLIYSTFLGGSNEDAGLGIAVDLDGNAYVTGYTDSIDFPTENAYQPANGGFRDAFVTKLNVEGNVLVYSTYLGGSSSENLVAAGQGESESAGGIAVDAFGNAYVTGVTRSTDFPTMNAFQPTHGGPLLGDDAFVVKLNAEGSALVYSSFLGGGSSDVGIGVAVDTSGNAYVTGATRSRDFPTVNPFQEASGGGRDAFIVMISDTTGGLTTLSMSPTSVVPGDTVTATWSGISTPTATDWIGLYLQGTDDFQLIDRIYVSCTQIPGNAQADGSCPFIIPADLMPETYDMGLFSDDGFTGLATSNPLTVGEGIGTLSIHATKLSPAPSGSVGLEALDAFDGGQGDAVEVVFYEDAFEMVWDLAGRAMPPLPFSLDDSEFIVDGDPSSEK